LFRQLLPAASTRIAQSQKPSKIFSIILALIAKQLLSHELIVTSPVDCNIASDDGGCDDGGICGLTLERVLSAMEIAARQKRPRAKSHD
jgi:hypothetical protein